MTLIATLRVHATPVLVGDLLITGGRQDETRRKVSLLRDNLAIAWAGSLLDAQAFFRHLDALLPPVARTTLLRQAIEEAARRTQPISSLQLVGWLIDGDATPFAWDAQASSDLLLGKLAALGSGGPVLLRSLPDLSIRNADGTTPSSFDRVARDVLYDVGQLLKSEFGARDLRKDFFIGGGYDILIKDGDRFRYASPAVYAVVSVPVDRDGEVLSAPITLGLVVSRVIGEYNIRQSWYRLHNPIGSYDITITDPIAPGGDDRILRRMKQLRRPLKFTGDFLAADILFDTDGYTWPPCAYVAERNPAYWSGSTTGITLNAEHIRIAARAVAADLRQRADR